MTIAKRIIETTIGQEGLHQGHEENHKKLMDAITTCQEEGVGYNKYADDQLIQHIFKFTDDSVVIFSAIDGATYVTQMTMKELMEYKAPTIDVNLFPSHPTVQ